MGLRAEILEQPAAAQRLLDSAPTAFAPIAAALRSRRPRFAVIAARGTSDNAGIYAQYLLAIRNGYSTATCSVWLLCLAFSPVQRSCRGGVEVAVEAGPYPRQRTSSSALLLRPPLVPLPCC